LVVDSRGVIKKSVIAKASNSVKAYLTHDYISPNANFVIHRIAPFRPVGEVPTNFDRNTGAFTVQKSGIYKASISVTIADAISNPHNNNYVVGIYMVQGGTNQWISRASIIRNQVDVGISQSSISFVQLSRGEVIYFGTAGGAKLFANPEGASGRGIGTFFQIELISEN